MYKQGRGRPLDDARGKELTGRACKAGELDACVILVDDASAAGDETLRRYCEQERVASACFAYGQALAEGRGIKQDVAQARSYFERASRGDGLDQPSTQALYGLAAIETDDGRAASIFQSACDKHLPEACAEYGRMLAYGKGVSADPVTAVRLLQTGCDQDHNVPSCRNLYSVSWDGKGTLSKPAAAEGLEGLCTKGDPTSCMLAGNAYRMGASPGVAQSPKKAKLYFDRACKLGVKEGCKASPWPPAKPKTACDELKSFAHTCYTESASPDVTCSDAYSLAEAGAAAAGVTGELAEEVATFCGRACQASKGGVPWSVVDAAISSAVSCPR